MRGKRKSGGKHSPNNDAHLSWLSRSVRFRKSVSRRFISSSRRSMFSRSCRSLSLQRHATGLPPLLNGKTQKHTRRQHECEAHTPKTQTHTKHDTHKSHKTNQAHTWRHKQNKNTTHTHRNTTNTQSAQERARTPTHKTRKDTQKEEHGKTRHPKDADRHRKARTDTGTGTYENGVAVREFAITTRKSALVRSASLQV